MLAGAALFAVAVAPGTAAGYGSLGAVAVVLAVDAASSAGRLSSSRAALAGFGAALLALVWAALGGVPGPALIALAVAALGGVGFVARGAFEGVACFVLAAAAASSGAAFHGDVPYALAIAAVVSIAGALVVVPANALMLDLEDAIRWIQRHERPVSVVHSTEASAELDRARAEAMAARQALIQGSEIRRLAELQTLEALRTKDAFLARMSHELRTPLNQILGYSELLLEESADADAAQIRGDIERIRLAGRNLLEILDNTLDLSRIEAGKQEVRMEEILLSEFLQELVDSAAAAARRRGNTVRLRCARDIGVLRTDRAKLRKILGALLSNACKFTENGTVRVAVHRDPMMMRFEVSDTGLGIAQEALGRLFEPFYQADDSTTRRHDGAGLGLTLCKHLTTMLGGEIGVDSEPGRGSTFTLQLPHEFKSPRAAGIVLMSISSSSHGAR